MAGTKVEKSNVKSRSWIFTDYTGNEEKFLDPPDWVKYTAYSNEVCPTTGRPHLQGYLEVHEPMRMAQIKMWMPTNYLHTRDGSLRANKAYCSKEGQLIECGEAPAQGRRVDLISVKRRIDEGETVDDIEDDENFFGTIVKHRKFFEQYERKKRRKVMKDDFTAIEVYIRYGLPGTGKTAAAYDYANEHYGGSIYRLPTNSGTNFGSYNGESVVLFDDVKAGEVPSVSILKKLTDRYPDEVRVLYGWIPWKPKVVFITSNWEPGTWWPDLADVDYDAISRRVVSVTEVFKDKEIIHFKDGIQQTEEVVLKDRVFKGPCAGPEGESVHPPEAP